MKPRPKPTRKPGRDELTANAAAREFHVNPRTASKLSERMKPARVRGKTRWYRRADWAKAIEAWQGKREELKKLRLRNLELQNAKLESWLRQSDRDYVSFDSVRRHAAYLEVHVKEVASRIHLHAGALAALQTTEEREAYLKRLEDETMAALNSHPEELPAGY